MESWFPEPCNLDGSERPHRQSFLPTILHTPGSRIIAECSGTTRTNKLAKPLFTQDYFGNHWKSSECTVPDMSSGQSTYRIAAAGGESEHYIAGTLPVLDGALVFSLHV